MSKVSLAFYLPCLLYHNERLGNVWLIEHGLDEVRNSLEQMIKYIQKAENNPLIVNTVWKFYVAFTHFANTTEYFQISALNKLHAFISHVLKPNARS